MLLLTVYDITKPFAIINIRIVLYIKTLTVLHTPDHV